MIARVTALAFIHVPKTGGLSLRNLLARYYGPSAICGVREAREMAFLGEAASRYRLFLGHFLAAQAENLRIPGLRTFTLLRDPAERLVSHFHYWSRPEHRPSAGFPGEERAMLAREGVGRFIADPALELRRNFAEAVTRQFGFGPERIAGVGPYPRLSAEKSHEVLGQALTRLAAVDVVGLYERYRESLQLLAYAMGWPAIRHVPWMNARKEGVRAALSASDRESLLASEPCDVTMYASAQRIFGARYGAMVSELAARYGGATADADAVDAWLDRRHREMVWDGSSGSVPGFVEASDPVFHDDWHVPEWSESAGWARWSGSASAFVDLGTGGPGPKRLVARVVHVHAESEPFRVEVDGVERPYRRSDCFGGGYHLEAEFTASGPVVRVAFRVGKTWCPAEGGSSGDERRLGVMIQWIAIRDAVAGT